VGKGETGAGAPGANGGEGLRALAVYFRRCGLVLLVALTPRPA
jgi:hypothetical protein